MSGPQAVSGKHSGVALASGLAPMMGPRCVTQTIDFSVAGASPKQINFAESQNLGKIEFIQTVKVDNSINPSPLSIFNYLTNNTDTIPPYAMAYLPVLSSKNSANFTISTAGNVLVGLYFLSMALPALVWFPNGPNGSGGGYASNPGQSAGTDYSANLAAVGANLITTIPASVAGTTRNGVNVQNQAAQQIQLLLDDGTIILLESGGADNVGGGAWNSVNYNGRVRIYSNEALAPVAAYVF